MNSILLLALLLPTTMDEIPPAWETEKPAIPKDQWDKFLGKDAPKPKPKPEPEIKKPKGPEPKRFIQPIPREFDYSIQAPLAAQEMVPLIVHVGTTTLPPPMVLRVGRFGRVRQAVIPDMDFMGVRWPQQVVFIPRGGWLVKAGQCDMEDGKVGVEKCVKDFFTAEQRSLQRDRWGNLIPTSTTQVQHSEQSAPVPQAQQPRMIQSQPRMSGGQMMQGGGQMMRSSGGQMMRSSGSMMRSGGSMKSGRGGCAG